MCHIVIILFIHNLEALETNCAKRNGVFLVEIKHILSITYRGPFGKDGNISSCVIHSIPKELYCVTYSICQLRDAEPKPSASQTKKISSYRDKR